MSPEELLNQMSYDNEQQLEEAKKYIAIKGIVQYQRAINFCLVNSAKPSYTTVSALYRYDKRLRDKLYVYIATAEEYMRARIGNTYEDNFQDLKTSDVFDKKFKDYQSVSLTLEQLTLGQLKGMVAKNQDIFNGIYDLVHLESNLNALRVLRNKVGHHNFLLAETYEVCVINDAVDNSLRHNILNLANFLPDDFKDGFVSDVNKCGDGLKIYNSEWLINIK